MESAIRLKNISVEFERGAYREFRLKEVFLSMFKARTVETFPALKNIDLEIPKGEVFGIIGKNGAGKSTLLKVISGIIAPIQGKVETKGIVTPLLELGIGFHPELSGRENCELYASIFDYPPSFMKQKIQDIIDFSEIGEAIDSPIKHYSSGMYARLAFTLATDIKPDILILDEIFSVGDYGFQSKSAMRMNHLIDSGCTTLIVSHNLSFLRQRCTRVLWLEKGAVVQCGEAGAVIDAYQNQIEQFE